MTTQNMGRGAALLAAATLCLVGLAAHAGDLRAGAGKVSITPPADVFPYLAPREKPIVGVHDDVFARALVLDDGKARVAIVSLEVTTVPTPDALVKAVAEAAGVTPGHVLLSATHTHSTPLTFFHSSEPSADERREIERVRAGAVQATKAAVASLRPARIASGRGEAFVNINNGEEAGFKGWYDPKGASDKTLDVVRLVDASGAPLAALINYANHAEVMFRSVTRDGGYEVTGDLPGAVSRILEGPAKAAPVVLFTAGAEGDQLPLLKSLQPDAELPASDTGPAGWGVLDLLARRLAVSAMGVMNAMPAGEGQAQIGVASAAVTCPGQRYQRDPQGGPPARIDTDPVAIPLTVVRINDIALAGVGADIASDIGKAIKAASPAPKTTVVTMAAGAVGYVLNDNAYAKPTHGVMGSPVKPGCAAAALSTGVARLVDDAKR